MLHVVKKKRKRLILFQNRIFGGNCNVLRSSFSLIYRLVPKKWFCLPAETCEYWKQLTGIEKKNIHKQSIRNSLFCVPLIPFFSGAHLDTYNKVKLQDLKHTKWNHSEGFWRRKIQTKTTKTLLNLQNI